MKSTSAVLPAPAHRRLPRSPMAFTLLELLVVVGLIAGLSLVLFVGLPGGGRAASLQSAQATVHHLVTAARLKAFASGRHCRVLVAKDIAEPERYLKYLVLQQARQAGPNPPQWDTVQTIFLPGGTYVVPAALSPPAGLVADESAWRRVSEPGAELVSGVFQNQELVYAPEGEVTARRWTGVCFTPNGTLTSLAGGPPPRGLLILANGSARAPGSYAAGDSPVQLADPGAVRGLVLSAYGVPALLNDRSAF